MAGGSSMNFHLEAHHGSHWRLLLASQADIVSYTQLTSKSTPVQILELLDQVYTTFDDLVDRHSLYKVGTASPASLIPQPRGCWPFSS